MLLLRKDITTLAMVFNAQIGTKMSLMTFFKKESYNFFQNESKTRRGND